MAKAEKIRDFFISEPGNVFEMLTQGTRSAMITMAEQGDTIESETQLDGTSKILVLEDEYMKVQNSASKTTELRMLTKGKADTVIVVVETVKLPVLDSQISFYDSHWQPLKAEKVMKGGIPTLKDFVPPSTAKKDAEKALKEVDMQMISMVFEGESHSKLVVKQQLKNFYSKEDYKKYGFLLNQLTYEIKNTKLVLVK